jgi:hypothetical protein
MDFKRRPGVTDHSTLADVITQEAGHMFGLAHDGLDDGVEYYSGHGTGATSWGPVMGAPWTSSRCRSPTRYTSRSRRFGPAS